MSVQFCTVPPSQKSGSPDVPQVLCDFSVRCALSSLLRSIWMVAPQLTFAVSMHTTCRQRNYGLDGKELTAEEHPLETMVDGIYTCLGP